MQAHDLLRRTVKGDGKERVGHAQNPRKGEQVGWDHTPVQRGDGNLRRNALAHTSVGKHKSIAAALQHDNRVQSRLQGVEGVEVDTVGAVEPRCIESIGEWTGEIQFGARVPSLVESRKADRDDRRVGLQNLRGKAEGDVDGHIASRHILSKGNRGAANTYRRNVIESCSSYFALS